MSTDYHAQYWAHELTRRRASDESDKFSSTFYNATVDLNPHQIDAALFAFRNPLSRGAILADEVGLGKTIEAGLVISQLWAERKRNDKRRALFDQQDTVDKQKDTLITRVESQLKQKVEMKKLFEIRWRVV
jgi:SNF2 family DNA or RNA helicase